jgi:hypothetical protein
MEPRVTRSTERMNAVIGVLKMKWSEVRTQGADGFASPRRLRPFDTLWSGDMSAKRFLCRISLRVPR